MLQSNDKVKLNLSILEWNTAIAVGALLLL